MSFSVKAGTSPVQQPTPVPQPYVPSPNLGPSAAGSTTNTRETSTANGNAKDTPPTFQHIANSSTGSNPPIAFPPPFTLTAAAIGGDDDARYSNGNTSNGNNAANGQRRGTDPSKYKTSICRNWEQTGTCSFRGCTFAHGVDELRAPLRQGQSPPLGGSPLTGPTALGNSPTLGPNATGTPGPTAPPAAGGSRVEQLLEVLMTEVNKERDLAAVHAEANRTLEAMLRREQQLRAEQQQQIDAAVDEITALRRQLREKDEQLGNPTTNVPLPASAQRQALGKTVAPAGFGPFGQSPQQKPMNGAGPGPAGGDNVLSHFASSFTKSPAMAPKGAPMSTDLSPLGGMSSAGDSTTGGGGGGGSIGFAPSLDHPEGPNKGAPPIESPNAPDSDQLRSLLNALNTSQ